MPLTQKPAGGLKSPGDGEKEENRRERAEEGGQRLGLLLLPVAFCTRPFRTAPRVLRAAFWPPWLQFKPAAFASAPAARGGGRKELLTDSGEVSWMQDAGDRRGDTPGDVQKTKPSERGRLTGTFIEDRCRQSWWGERETEMQAVDAGCKGSAALTRA